MVLFQLPYDGMWANVKDWSWPQLAFVLAVVVVVLSFSLARRLLKTGTQTFQGQENDRRDAIAMYERQLKREAERADKAEAARDAAFEERDDIQQELNGLKWMEKRPDLLRSRAKEIEDQQRETPALSSKGHILIVEDNDDARTGLAMNLRLMFYSVEEASGAMKAIALCASARLHHHFDLILLDESMPLLSGQDFVRMLRSEGDNTPIVFLTAHGDDIDMDEMRNLGVLGIWEKPVPIRDLPVKLENVLR